MELDDHSKLCRAATEKDIEGVVRVHLQAFDGFFLSMLGPRFLKVMYTSFLVERDGVFVVWSDSGDISGFAVGARAGGTRDRTAALRYFPHFVIAIIPALLTNPVLVVSRLLRRFFDIGDKPDIPSNAVMLRSIGVLPSVKGGGVAGKLLTSFEKAAESRGIDSVVLTTDMSENERAINFYTKHGYCVLDEFRQDGTRMMYLMQKKIRGGV